MRLTTAVTPALALLLSATIPALSQTESAQTDAAATAAAPVAYVYVASSTPGSTTAAGHIYGYAASSAGTLTPLPGSPLQANVSYLAVNGKYLFGTFGNPNYGNYNVYSYSIASNGAIKLADTVSVNGEDSEPINLSLDRTGATLYSEIYDSDSTAFQSLSIDPSNGKLSPLNISGFSTGDSALAFTGNDKFAYGVSCFRFTPTIMGLERTASSGALNQLAISPSLPAASSGDMYCPVATAADPSNDVVLSLEEVPDEGGNIIDSRLAVYTAGTSGDLTTTSTEANMATTRVEPDVLAMSPEGYYLAVGGPTGVQFFLMHGSKPLTGLTDVILPSVTVTQMLWDNNQHLYVISSTSNKLYVLSVSTDGVKEVAGSPYSIPSITNLTVLPK